MQPIDTTGVIMIDWANFLFQVQLIKLKMKAVAVGSTVPPEDRIHLLVCLPLQHNTRTLAVSLDKVWSVGKTIDAVASKAKVSCSVRQKTQIMHYCLRIILFNLVILVVLRS